MNGTESAPLSESDERIQHLRRELIATELEILELNDKVRAKEIDRVDAVALLSQAELMLEEKISYILTLDRALNARIRELEEELDRKSAEIDRRGEALAAARADDERHRAERDAVIQDLSDRLEAANQEISRAHGLAGEYAAKFNDTTGNLQQETARHADTRQQLAKTQDQLADSQAKLVEEQSRLTETVRLLGATESAHAATSERLTTAKARLAAIEQSSLWRWSKPWRALFGPKE